MVTNKIINDTSDLPSTNEWIDSTEFNTKEMIVDKNGNRVDSEYFARIYKVIAQKERYLSFWERMDQVASTWNLANLFVQNKEIIQYGVEQPSFFNCGEKNLIR